jgi:hypothetical protein
MSNQQTIRISICDHILYITPSQKNAVEAFLEQEYSQPSVVKFSHPCSTSQGGRWPKLENDVSLRRLLILNQHSSRTLFNRPPDSSLLQLFNPHSSAPSPLRVPIRLAMPSRKAMLGNGVLTQPKPAVASKLPTTLQFPLVVLLSFSTSVVLFSAASAFTGLELATVSSRIENTWEVLAFPAWRIFELAVGWFMRFDGMC